MKIGRFSSIDGHSGGIGVIFAERAVPVPDSPSMIALIEDFDRWRPHLASLRATDPSAVALADIKLLSPITRPGKIMGIGFNYADHAREAATELPTEQMWFSKASTAINDPYGDIDIPRVSPTLDYEAELVIVIGKKCRDVSRDDAPGVIFGFCAGNDASVREWQFKTSQFVLGKSFDTTAPIGPWIVTADAINPGSLDISSYVNGELRQRSNTRNLVFDCAAMIEHLSMVMTLEPGDLIFTGTPAGVGASMKPPVWLAEGDVVRVEIQSIGVIENRVRKA